jgi:hypothetical protein
LAVARRERWLEKNMIATPPPPLSSEAELRYRLERFEKTVTMCLCIVPFIFSAQCLFVSLASPIFAAMFSDFGAKLPGPTLLVFSTWRFWAVIAVVVPVAAVIAARQTSATFSLVFSTVSGLVMFLVAQCITLSLCLPIFQLGAIAEGLK